MNGRSLNPGDQSRARLLALNKRAHTTPHLLPSGIPVDDVLSRIVDVF